MYRRERQELFRAVIARRPQACYEIGTGAGGGSTYFLASAFKKLGHGTLFSLEADAPAHIEAKRRYSGSLRKLRPFVELLHGASPDAFLPSIQAHGSCVECFFLDGSNSSEEALSQYNFFLPYVAPGTVLMAHDWDGDKMTALRPIVEGDPRWRQQVRLQSPESVGFVVYEFTRS